jgi:hypothetical protein
MCDYHGLAPIEKVKRKPRSKTTGEIVGTFRSIDRRLRIPTNIPYGAGHPNLKNMPIRFLVINILKEVLAILGCLLFVFSFFYPLYYAEFIALAGFGSTYYWSYKVDIKNDANGVLNSNHLWFSSYWFSSYGWIPWTLIFVFAVQVLTLVFGIASIIFNRRILSFAPVLLSLTVIELMICTGGRYPDMCIFMEDITKAIILFIPQQYCSCPPLH